jgi:hypothetical protein
MGFLLFALFLSAQNDEPEFFILDYMKVKPGMGTKYIECEKVWKTIHQERLKAGKITGWYFYEVRFPNGTNTEYDYVTINRVKGWKGVDNFYSGWNEAYTAATKKMTKEQLAVADNTEQYRDLVRSELWVAMDEAFNQRTKPANFQMVNYMDVPDGRWDEYMAMETKLVKPVHQVVIDNGKRAGWGLYSLVLPYGSEMPYQAATVDFYDKWENIGGGGMMDALKKVHPNMSEAYFSRQINETRTLVRGELRVLVDYVE